MGRIPLGELPESQTEGCFTRKPPERSSFRQVPSRRRPNGLYDVLGVQFGAPADAIKRAYRKKALVLHPDKLPSNSTTQARSAATKQLQELNNAYEILRDTHTRETYDRKVLHKEHKEPRVDNPSSLRVRVHRHRQTADERRISEALNTARRRLMNTSLARRALTKPKKKCLRVVVKKRVTAKSRVISPCERWSVCKRKHVAKKDGRWGKFVAYRESELT